MFLIIFSVLLIVYLLVINFLSVNGYLNDKQYRIYCIVIFIGFLFLCGILENYCNIKNGY